MSELVATVYSPSTSRERYQIFHRRTFNLVLHVWDISDLNETFSFYQSCVFLLSLFDQDARQLPQDKHERCCQTGSRNSRSCSNHRQRQGSSHRTSQKTQDQLTMLRILAHGRKQVEEGKVTDHDEFFAQLEAEDNENH